MVYSALGQYVDAIETQTVALELRQRWGNAIGAGQSLGNLGVIHSHLGDFAASLEYHVRALEQREQCGDEAGRALTLNNIGVVYFELGDLETPRVPHASPIGSQGMQ